MTVVRRVFVSSREGRCLIVGERLRDVARNEGAKFWRVSEVRHELHFRLEEEDLKSRDPWTRDGRNVRRGVWGESVVRSRSLWGVRVLRDNGRPGNVETRTGILRVRGRSLWTEARLERGLCRLTSRRGRRWEVYGTERDIRRTEDYQRPHDSLEGDRGVCSYSRGTPVPGAFGAAAKEGSRMLVSSTSCLGPTH